MGSVVQDADGLHSPSWLLDAALCSPPPAPAPEEGNSRLYRPYSQQRAAAVTHNGQRKDWVYEAY